MPIAGSVRAARSATPPFVAAGLMTCFLAVLAPVFLFSHPVLLDYQNHLARIWLIADPFHANAFYEIDWRNISNELGVDMIAMALRGHVGADGIGRLCLAAAIAMPPAGAILLNRQMFGRMDACNLLVPFFAWTLTALAGFLNFQIGLGLALIAAAADPLWGCCWWARMAGRTLFGLAILLDHGLALAFYLVLLLGMQLGRIDEPFCLQTLKRDIAGALTAAATALIPLLVIMLVTHTMPGDHDPARHARSLRWNSGYGILTALVSPLSTYDPRVDFLIACILACLIAGSLRFGRLSWHPGLSFVAAAMFALALFAPRGTPWGGWTDRRLPIMAVLTAISAIQITFPSLARRRLFGLLAIGLVAVRSTWIGWNWAGGQALQRSVVSAISAMAPGKKLLAVQHVPPQAEISAAPAGRFIYGDEITYRHLPALAVEMKGAFVPMLFTQRGVHPVHVRQAWLKLSNPEGGNLPPLGALADDRQIGPDAAYMRGWRRAFDYVLVLNADYQDASGSDRMPAGLRLVRDGGFAQLFAVTRDDR